VTSFAFSGSRDVPQWDDTRVVASGSNKEIFEGIYMDQEVAICVSRSSTGIDNERITHEIQIFERLNRHPHIIQLLYHSITGTGKIFMVQEQVQPIGFDLERLASGYWAKMMQVPTCLMVSILTQLVSALRHMHSCNILHGDLKAGNVLTTGEYDVKLVDMGIACEIGESKPLTGAHLAPEMCMGMQLRPEVDCWGLGVLLHQVYQRRWKLLDLNSLPVGFRKGMPSTKENMELSLKAAMKGLLRIQPVSRWSLDKLSEETLAQVAEQDR
jgi:serine/threonine protein kinase